ncbi:MAG: hypothetical protein GC172_07295 [Phycisphaera sp.]|nr:hypothetical protein [Phycisphaera sp.]
MGPWFVRNAARPHFVGCSYATLLALVRAGEVGRDTVVRGPSTRQFWTVARRAAGLAHLFGRCHACQGPVTIESPVCGACGAAPHDATDRSHFGIGPIETVVPPQSQPVDPLALVKTAFAPEGDMFFVRVTPLPPPERSVVRVQPPAPVAVDPPAPAPAQVAAVSSAPSAPVAPSVADPVRTERVTSPAIDRGLSERVRDLTRLNRMLLVATILVSASALILGGAYVILRDARSSELAEARAKAIAEVRAEFERAEPVTKSGAVQLPAEPPSPPTTARPPEAPRR